MRSIHPTRRALMRLWLCLACLGGPALAQDQAPLVQDDPGEGLSAFVDRFSERLDAALAGEADSEKLRPLEAPRGAGERATVTGLRMAAPQGTVDQIKLTITQPGKGPRLLLVDAGAVLRGPGGADYVLLPNQKFLLENEQVEVVAEALPLSADQPAPPPETPLKAVLSNDPGVIALLRTVQRLEAEDTQRLSRYVSEKDGAPKVDTFLDNQDVRLARRMRWSHNVVGKLEGRLPREEVALALLAITAGHTITQAVDWLRLNEKLDLQPAIDRSWELAPGVEYLLERATLNHRIYSPRHAEYHFNQGVAAYTRGDLDAAEAAFKKALEKNAKLTIAQFNLGVVLYRKGDYAGARGIFLVASGMDGADADTLYNRGATDYRLGDKAAAARAFRKALELNPRHAQAEEWLAKADPEGATAPAEAPKKGKPSKGKRK